MRVKGLWITLLGLAVAGAALFYWQAKRPAPSAQARLESRPAETAAAGFARVTSLRTLTFPADFGPHPDYQTEWWYYTGNLDSAGGRHFGYQLTFFRRGLLPPSQTPNRPSDWATSQVYMAHFALTDAGSRRYQAYERFGRGAAGLAGAQAQPYQVWLEDWRVEQTQPGEYHLLASQDGISIDLFLTDRKGPVLQGNHGYSQKGPDPGQASYYYSLTRLESRGTVTTTAGTVPVSGLSWMDHEFSTSYLSQNEVGWDWFSLQLSDGSELMLFNLRRKDGSFSPASSGTLVSPDGQTRRLSQADFQITVQATWKSPRTQATYPARWTVKVPVANLAVEVEPWLADQELNVSYAYWEGAVHFRGEHQGQSVTGNGYVELTGYSSPMGGQF